MTANCHCRGRRPPASRAATRAGSSVALLTGIAAVIAPKCPLCLAAYLALLGIGSATARSIAPFLLPVGIGLLTLAVAALLVPRLLARRNA